MRESQSMNPEERFTDWQLLGKGGTAVVYKAFDQELQLDVAVKILLPKFAADQNTRSTMRQEIKTSRKLRHPAIVAIHDFYDGPMGFGVVLDIVPGGAELRDWMDDNQDFLRATAAVRLKVLTDIMRALVVAHDENIVHRDLKPQNIMLVDGDINRPIIMDFGLAVSLSTEEATIPGFTPTYGSPEQWYQWHEMSRGMALQRGRIDIRSDLFTMGVIAYELFTNRVPPTSLKLRESDAGLAPEPVGIEPPSRFCASLPPALDGLILSMMRDDPANRPQSAREILAALEAIEIDENAVVVSESDGGIENVAIESGNFILGSGPESSNSSEKPRRRVEISGFSIAKYPVTNAQYREFAERTGASPSPFVAEEQFGGDDNPVVGITWDDARAYCAWVGGRLPSEAEWEYVAKGGEKRIYPWGDEPPTPMHANLDRIRETTSPVGQFGAGLSRHGVMDLSGNVWEWCADTWKEDFYSDVAKGEQNPRCELPGDQKSVRGGAYNTFSEMGRNASRYHFAADTCSPAVGFRVAFDSD